eukprot:1675182-Pyramimonas_sp.AAC.1
MARRPCKQLARATGHQGQQCRAAAGRGLAAAHGGQRAKAVTLLAQWPRRRRRWPRGCTAAPFAAAAP